MIEFLKSYPDFDPDWCETCERIVPEGTEHSWQAHQGNEQYAKELAAWKQQLHETGAHH